MNHATRSAEAAAIVERLAGLSNRAYAAPEYVQFRIALLMAQTAVCDALVDSAVPQVSTLARRHGKAKGPPLAAGDVTLDRALLNGLLEDLATALNGHGGDSEVLAHLAAATAEDPDLLERLARKAAFGPDEGFLASLCQRLKTNREALLFFGRALAAPFVSEAVRQLKASEADAPLESCGSCPYCGSAAGLAKLRREEGRRILFCSLCGESWEFARIACPFCENQGPLEVMSLGTDETRWNETCTQCRHYLKTIDERKLPADEPFVPLVEATATLYLDLIAEQQDCAPGLPYSAPR